MIDSQDQELFAFTLHTFHTMTTTEYKIKHAKFDIAVFLLINSISIGSECNVLMVTLILTTIIIHNQIVTKWSQIKSLFDNHNKNGVDRVKYVQPT